MKHLLLLIITVILFINNASSQSGMSDNYPVMKFKTEQITLFDYKNPNTEQRIKINTIELGEPTKLEVVGTAGGSNEHLVINYKNRLVTFSRAKVILDKSFDKRTATGIPCSASNQNKNRKIAMTTSICEK